MSTTPIAPPDRRSPRSLPANPDGMVEQMRRLVRTNARRWKRLVALEALAITIAVPLAYLWGIFLLDNTVYLPVWGRLLAGGLFVVGMCFLAVRLVQRLALLRLSEDEVALAIERQAPGGVQNRLINALQISRGAGSIPTNMTPALVRENFDHLQKTTLPRATSGRPALVKLGLAIVLVAIGAGFWALRPDHFLNAANRLFMPFANIEPLYRTRLIVEPGDIEAEGDVAIRIRIEGEMPEFLTVTRQVQGQRLTEKIAVAGDGEVVPYTFLAVHQNLTYSVSGGDYTSPVFRIDVPTNPRLSLVRATYHSPAYTGREPFTSERSGGDLEALQGSRADVTFVFDHPAAKAALLLERAAPISKDGVPAALDRIDLTAVSPTEFQGTIPFGSVVGYEVEVQASDRPPARMGPFAVRVLIDQNPKLELTGLENQGEISVDSSMPLRIRASDDIGLVKVGLFYRRPNRDAAADEWQSIAIWPAEKTTEFTQTHDLLLAALAVAEGDQLELALRAIDNDPLKKGQWITGNPQKLLVGGEGAALQRLYEQILRTETELKGLIAGQRQLADRAIEQIKKLDPASGIRWDDMKNVTALNTSVAELAKAQEQLRQTASRCARDMAQQAGNLRISIGMLADTEIIRAIRILESLASRETPQAKRAVLAESRLTQDRTVRSMEEILEQYIVFRQDWETGHMIPFVEMLAEREVKLRDQSRKNAAAGKVPEILQASMKRRQAKVQELVNLARPAFEGMSERVKSIEPGLSSAFKNAAVALAAPALQLLLTQAGEEANAGHWTQAAEKQDAAAKELGGLYARLKKAQAEAALAALNALKQKAKSDIEAQKALEKLQAGTDKTFMDDISDKLKLEDILHMRDPGAGKKGDDTKIKPDNYLFPDSSVASLNAPDKGIRQDFNILKLATSPGKTPSFPKQSDRDANKITKAPIQEKFDDLVGQLLEEADEIQKKYETYNLNTSFNINEPGEIGKQGGDLNSTAASAATGNMKPPTSNVGGASRAGRRGARAHGMVVGDESINRRGRDKVQEGQEKVGDQAGTIKEKKSGDMQKDTSTGIGGKKVEGDNEVKFSMEDAGKWTDDMTKRMDKAQAKNFIVERKDGRLDPRVAEMLRDLNNRQDQVIERVKAIRKELKNLYLPTEHLDEILAQLQANQEALKAQPEPEIFRLQSQALDQLRSTVRVFQAPTSGFQPSLPRERALHGRVLDEPARDPLPGYEEAVKRYYENLSGQ